MAKEMILADDSIIHASPESCKILQRRSVQRANDTDVHWGRTRLRMPICRQTKAHVGRQLALTRQRCLHACCCCCCCIASFITPHHTASNFNGVTMKGVTNRLCYSYSAFGPFFLKPFKQRFRVWNSILQYSSQWRGKQMLYSHMIFQVNFSRTRFYTVTVHIFTNCCHKLPFSTKDGLVLSREPNITVCP